MKKYLVIVALLAFCLSGLALAADESKKAETPVVAESPKAPLADEDETGMKADAEHEMPVYDTYDQNTGMPDVVQSDKTGEIE